MTISFARHQFPPAIIRHAVWHRLDRDRHRHRRQRQRPARGYGPSTKTSASAISPNTRWPTCLSTASPSGCVRASGEKRFWPPGDRRGRAQIAFGVDGRIEGGCRNGAGVRLLIWNAPIKVCLGDLAPTPEGALPTFSGCSRSRQRTAELGRQAGFASRRILRPKRASNRAPCPLAAGPRAAVRQTVSNEPRRGLWVRPITSTRRSNPP